VIQGGITIEKQVNSIYRYFPGRLNISSLIWNKLPTEGEAPQPSQDPMLQYYEGSILQAGGYPMGEETCHPYLFSYSLSNFTWEVISDKSSKYSCRYLSRSFIYKDEFYMMFGWMVDDYADAIDVTKISLKSEDKTWKTIFESVEMGKDGHSSTIVDSNVYIFGGYYTASKEKSNKLEVINLEKTTSKVINENLLIPRPRHSHSMHLINTRLYVFGGKDSEMLYNEIWIFDPKTSLWESITAKGSVPSARFFHAADSQGDAFIIWGGEDSTGLKNDLFLFNSLTETWTELFTVSASKPSAAKGACLVFSSPMIYIYGGIMSSDISNELWQFELGSNNFTKLSAYGLRHTAYSTCYLKGNKFIVALGSMYEEAPSQQIDYFDLETGQWSVYHTHDEQDHDSAQSIQIMLKDKLIRIGGEEWMLTPSNRIDICGPGTEYLVLDDVMDIYLYASSFSYFNKSIYIFGGGSVLGLNLRSNVAHNLLIEVKIEDICQDNACEAVCSSGTFETSNSCDLCERGQFSEGQGNKNCSYCEAGTFNGNLGSTSGRQCLPCPEGTYNNERGSSRCLDCPVWRFCPVGSKVPIASMDYEEGSSVQPPLYNEPSFHSTTLFYQVTVSVVLGFLLLVILSMKRTRNKLQKIDLFKELHNNKLNEFLVLKQTKIGGFFSCLFFIAALVLIGTTFISFYLGNIQESKGLVPLVVLESEVAKFEAAELSVKVWLDLYGGECAVDGQCLSEIIISRINLACGKFESTCELSESHSCIIRLICSIAEIKPGAYLDLQLTEKLSYASGIQINMTSSSSVPLKISSVYTAIRPTSNNVFIGSDSSEFYFTATPSLFKSESTIWPSQDTGYHLSSGTSTKKGSQFRPEELPSVSFLKVKILIDKSSSALLTTRYFKQDAVYFISSLLGSVFGLLGVFGGIMKSFEGQVNNALEKKVNEQKSLDALYVKRKGITRELKDNTRAKKENFESPEHMHLKKTSDF
jgi:hypothetical protein